MGQRQTGNTRTEGGKGMCKLGQKGLSYVEDRFELLAVKLMQYIAKN